MKNLKIDSNVLRMSAVRSLAAHALDELHDLAELSERLIENELEALSARIKEKVSTLAFPENKFEQDWYNDDIYRLSEAFPRIQRYSLFTATMSAIEHHLNRMCNVAQQICNHSLSLTELHGRGIVRSVTYLTKVCGFKVSQKTGSEVYNLKMCQKIRNAIIHADGLPVGGDLKAIKHYQVSNSKFEMNDRNEIVLSAMFVAEVVYIAGTLFEIIAGEMRKRVKTSPSTPME